MAAYEAGTERRSESDIQGCLLSPTPFHIFLKKIRANTLEDHKGIFSIGGRIITNLRVSDDIDRKEAEEEELVSLVDHLDKISTPFGREIRAEKTKQHRYTRPILKYFSELHRRQQQYWNWRSSETARISP